MKNETLIQFFEWYCPNDGKHWQRFEKEAEQLLALGITATWLPPAYKGTKGEKSEGYDVYDLYDLGEFDQKGSVRTKYGTKQEYISAVRHARNAGIKVYVDVVLNHMGGAEEKEKIQLRQVDPADRTIFTSEIIEAEAFTKFRFPGRNGKYSDFNWDHHCFTGIDYLADREETGIYSIINEYGEGWEEMADTEKGNFDYLIFNDIETRNPAVRAEFKKWISWYYQTVPFDGVRLDAVKHISPSFFNEWIDYVRKEIDENLFILGEYWLSDDISVLLKYITITGKRMSLFDAPLHHNFSIASNERENFDLREIFKDALVSFHPELSVTFVDNHDTQPLQSLEEYTEQWFKPHAYALILLREKGYPCVFYPDIYGCCYTDKHRTGEAREITIPSLPLLPTLLRIRKDKAYGMQTDYFDDFNCVGWVRGGDAMVKQSGLAVLLSNHPEKKMSKQMCLGKQFSGKRLYNFIQPNDPPVVLDDEGSGMFSVAPASIAVWCLP